MISRYAPWALVLFARIRIISEGGGGAGGLGPPKLGRNPFHSGKF